MNSSSKKEKIPIDSPHREADYIKLYKQSITPGEREQFWYDQSREISWIKEPTLENTLKLIKPPFYNWFTDGTLNICYNVVDRHIKEGNGRITALISHCAYNNSTISYTYYELYQRVNIMSKILLDNGVKKGDTVIIESTVAPKTTREICIPTLEKISLLKCNEDFYVGFSPERLQPGKNGKKIKQITKLISGSSDNALEKVYDIYHLILPKNKLHKCSSLEVAETSKLLENIKRDVNIALLNEFQMICSDTGINFHDVLESAETKFNFNSATYRPGMVGGHCIGVDPYYFINYENEYNKEWYGLIDSARTVNEVVPFFLANNILNRINKEHPRITILGFSFKENCNDIRNTKIYDLYKCLTDAGAEVYIVDNKCNKKLVKEQYDIDLLDEILIGNDCIFVALNEPDLIPHDIESKLYDDGFIFDYKGLFKDYLDDIANNNLIDKNKIPFDRIITL